MVQLLELRIEGFGKFADEKTINFTDGINFITGLNEAGKSTVLEAIMASIFKYSRGQIEPYFCWKNNEVCKTSLTYKTEKGETFRITTDYKAGKRRLEKIENKKTKEISSVDKNIDSYLKEHFGFDDKKVFENTAFIRQSQMAILEDAPVRKSIKDMVEEVFAGRSEASATNALSKINKVVKSTRKRIEVLKNEHENLESRLESAKSTREHLDSDSANYELVTKELQEKAQKLAKLRANEKAFQEKEALSKEEDNLNEKIDKIDNVIVGIREILRKKETLAQELEAYKGYDTIADLENLRRSINQLESNQASLNALKQSGTTTKVVSEKYDRRYVALLALGIVLCIIVVGIPLVIYAYKRLRIREEKEIPDEAKVNQITQLEQTIVSMKNAITAKCAKIPNFNLQTFANDSFKYIQLMNSYKYLSDSIRELSKSQLDLSEVGNDSEENLRKLEAKKTKYLNELTIVKNNLKEYKLLNFTQENADELRELDNRVAELKNKQTELRTRINTTVSLITSPEEIIEKLDANEEEQLTLEKRIEEHELAAKFLALAMTEVQQKFTPSIEKNSKPLLKEITRDRYSDVKIDEETLEITVKTPETQNYAKVNNLSQGTKDQLYFTLRTVMADLLGGDTNIPLVLDDPFHNFDELRLDKTINSIKQISKNKQIILISHRPYHEEFKDFCNNIVEL
jgi:DNA repair exonuclease SbcCD ATPase subunit